MQHPSLLPLAALAVALAATPASARHPNDGAIRIEGAWSRATAPRAAIGAGYLTIRNHGARADRLLTASSPRAARVEIHTMTMNGGVMRMRPLPQGMPVGPKQVLRLAPGGAHLMLIGLTAPLKAGERIPVTLRFQHAGAVPLRLAVAPIRASGPMSGHEGHH